MSIRLLLWVVLLGAVSATAAPVEKAETASTATEAVTAPADIDVDAMARAKDVDASAPQAKQPPADPAADASQTPAAGAAERGDKDASTNTDPGAMSDTSSAPPADSPVEAAPASDDANAEQPPEAVPEDPSSVPMSPQIPDSEKPEVRLAAACESRAAALLDAAEKGDFAAATRDFDAKMRSALPAAKLKKAWDSLAQFGALKARGQPHPATGKGYLVVTIPLIFDKANLYAQTACGSDGRIAGFFVKPLEMPAQ